LETTEFVLIAMSIVNMNLPLTINLSQSALGYHGCILELYRIAVQGYHEVPSSNIVYGEAVHKYRHVMYQTGGHIPTARVEAIKTFNQPKTENRKSSHLADQNHMLTTAFNFWELFVKKDTDLELLAIDGKPASELSFSIPYYKDEFVDVNLCGTLDGLGKIKGGCYVIPDLKTTSAWDKKNYFGGYRMSRQLRLYRLALKLMSTMHPDSILGQVGATNIGARIDALFIKPSPNDNTYASSDVLPITNQEVEEFQRLLDYKIQELSRAVREQYFPKQGIINNSCIGKWGMCIFSNVCAANDPNVAEILLKRDFKQRNYNPLNYSGL